jgi:hypothetical protein
MVWNKSSKYILLILMAIAITISGCKNSNGEKTIPEGPENSLPVIKADNEHLQAEQNDGTVPPAYEIPARNGFILDTTGYEIQIPSGLSITHPNMIQIVLDKDQMYYVKWETGKTSYTITSQTLSPLQNSKPFSSLKSGQAVVVAIGFLDDNGQATGQVAFYPLWYAIVNVR